MNMMKTVLMAVCVLVLAGCKTHPDYASDFRFPILRGDIERGQEAFVELGCNRCHSVYDAELPAYAGTRPFDLQLGGEMREVKTYGALVTSIINPSHVLSEEYSAQMPGGVRASSSPMPFHSEMTVSQMVDVVTFLNASYRLLPGYSEEFYY